MGKNVGGTEDDCGRSVAIDSSGNSYVTGWFSGTVDFDPGAGVDSHTSNGFYDVFLSKFDQNGNFIWARTWGGPGDDYAYSVAADYVGNVYVAGSFLDTVDFDPAQGPMNTPAMASVMPFFASSISTAISCGHKPGGE